MKDGSLGHERVDDVAEELALHDEQAGEAPSLIVPLEELLDCGVFEAAAKPLDHCPQVEDSLQVMRRAPVDALTLALCEADDLVRRHLGVARCRRTAQNLENGSRRLGNLPRPIDLDRCRHVMPLFRLTT